MQRLSSRHLIVAAIAIAALSTISPVLGVLAAIAIVAIASRNKFATVVVAVALLFACAAVPSDAIQLANPDANLSWLKDISDKFKLAFQLVALGVVALGLIFGAIHFVRHREQWMQAIEVVIGGVIAAAFIYHLDAVISIGAAGAVVR